MEIKVLHQVMEWNQDVSAKVRKTLADRKVCLINVMGSPGTGKTSLITALIKRLGEEFAIGVIEGDIAGQIDAEKIAALNIPAVQLNTDGACHIEAMSIEHILPHFDLDKLDVLFVENIGNLVCPAEFDIGENFRITILSIPEGDDKVKKYPLMFTDTNCLVLNKYDMLPYFDFDVESVKRDYRGGEPGGPPLRSQRKDRRRNGCACGADRRGNPGRDSVMEHSVMKGRMSGPGAGRQCVRVKVSGIVQGVGMRPFLHRLARSLQVTGWARNTLEGVEMVLEGDTESLSSFVREVRENPPPLAVVEAVELMADSPERRTGPEERIQNFETFEIVDSSSELPGNTLIAPDMAPCPDCVKELFSPSDRRFRYPFINCTNCGPRFTIIKALPYDRARTSMENFPMCPACREEYGDIENRRYHAQPDCCPVCGPAVYFLDSAGERAPGDPFRLAQEMLLAGGILAVKGIGGIHLACDAGNAGAVERLRRIKHREAKPLAVMCASFREAERFCRISGAERRILESPRRPIVLCEKRCPGSLTELSENSRLGVMLPYTPLHVLLLDGAFGGPKTLVMTSANAPDCPVLTENEEALSLLKGQIDGFLLHNRPIENRCDDSLVMEWQGREYFFRRSRGYAPQPVPLEQEGTGILALGAQQKASFALGQGKKAFLSQHIGDLDSLEAQDFFRENISRFAGLLHIRPGFLACDLHPVYESTKIGEEMAGQKGIPLLKIQHHWAHMAACMADNRLEGDAFGIIWDGTGMGTDGTIWGAECLSGNYAGFERRGSIRPILLPGREEAIRRIGRIGFSLLWDLGRGTPFLEENAEAAPLEGGIQERRALTAMLEKRISCVEASSMGRLFDGVDALLEGRARARYEGEGAVLLEALGEAGREAACPYPLAFYEEAGVRCFDTRPMIKQIVLDKQARVPSADIARRFMETLAAMALEQCLHLNTGKHPVILSGGVFQNHFLLERVRTLLEEAGFAVFCHRRVAPNDQGISLGQLAIAQRSEEYRVFGSAVKDNKN